MVEDQRVHHREKQWANPADYLSAIIETQHDVSAVGLDPDTVMNLVVERAQQMTGCGGAAIYLIEDGTIRCRAAGGSLDGLIGQTMGPQAAAAHVIRAGQLLYWHIGWGENAATNAAADARPDGPSGEANHCAVIAPIHQDGQVIGALEVVSVGDDGPPIEGHAPALRLLAGLLGAAFSHAAELQVKERMLADRQETLALLRESQERFRRAFEDAAIGMALVAPDGRWLQVNRSLCELIGYSSDELLRINFQTITHPDDLEADLEYVDQLLTGKIRTFQMQKRYYHKSGHVVWIQLSVSLVRDPTGQPQYFIAQIQDITERKHASTMEVDRREVMEMVAREAPLNDVLHRLVGLMENQMEEAVVALMLLQDGAMAHISPTLPPEFADAVAARALRVAAGLSALYGDNAQPVGISHLRVDECWSHVRNIAAAHGFKTAWFLQVFQKDGSQAGLIVAYCRRERPPGPGEAQLLSTACELASVVLERHQAVQQMAHMVRHDPLTGIPNRMMLEDRLEQAIAMSRRDGKMMAVLALDIDKFKHFNDTLGHDVGDGLLQQFAHRLRSTLRDADTLARIGGDEFMAVLPGLQGPEGALTVAEKLMAALAEPLMVGQHKMAVTSSLGISLFPRDGSDVMTLQKAADAAMYRVKRAGRNGFAFAETALEVKT